VASVDRALRALDGATAALARGALTGMRHGGSGSDPDVARVRTYLRDELPAAAAGRDRHETAWALGDLFEAAGLVEQAALCRAPDTHAILAVWRWADTFRDVPPAFWRPSVARLDTPAGAPPRVELSLAGVRALLEVVGTGGLTLVGTGELPTAEVVALDDRFRWTEQFPWMHRTGERGIPPLRFLHEHLTAQGLLEHRDGRVLLTASGAAALRDVELLWQVVVDPSPRWSHEFERDTLGLMAASLLRSGEFRPDRVTEEVAAPLARKWRPADEGVLFDGASLVVHAWYRLGVPLGWWDTGRGPADRHANGFGSAAATAVFRSMGLVTHRSTEPGAATRA
jgi:hypothetical protein